MIICMFRSFLLFQFSSILFTRLSHFTASNSIFLFVQTDPNIIFQDKIMYVLFDLYESLLFQSRRQIFF